MRLQSDLRQGWLPHHRRRRLLPKPATALAHRLEGPERPRRCVRRADSGFGTDGYGDTPPSGERNLSSAYSHHHKNMVCIPRGSSLPYPGTPRRVASNGRSRRVLSLATPAGFLCTSRRRRSPVNRGHKRGGTYRQPQEHMMSAEGRAPAGRRRRRCNWRLIPSTVRSPTEIARLCGFRTMTRSRTMFSCLPLQWGAHLPAQRSAGPTLDVPRAGYAWLSLSSLQVTTQSYDACRHVRSRRALCESLHCAKKTPR